MSPTYAQINKETLKHIISTEKIDIKYLAQKTRLSIDKCSNFINSDSKLLPTISQAKKIALCLHIPFAALYMEPSKIPVYRLPNVKNRRLSDGEIITDNSALNIAITDLLRTREFLLDIDNGLGYKCENFAPPIPSSPNPKIWAKYIRDFFSLDTIEQYKFKSTRQFYLYLKSKIESKGVLIQSFGDVPLENTRGLSIYKKKLPIIGINENDRPPAKSFSIIHEMVHLYKRESSICNVNFNMTIMQNEEVFCNAVAGELLVPEDDLQTFLRINNIKVFKKKDIQNIADYFSVSREVIIRRLLDTNKIDSNSYDEFRRELLKELIADQEARRLERQSGKPQKYRRNISLEAFDNTSVNICNLFYNGYKKNIYSKIDIARHLGISYKHVDGFLREVSKWSN